MDINEHYYVCLNEEATEIAHICDKILRFGKYDVNVLHPNGPNNTERLVEELNHFLAVVGLMVDQRLIPGDWQKEAVQQYKIQKVIHFCNYSIKQGTLR